MSNLLNISSSPHVRDKSSTRSIMWDVIFALIPTSIFGIYNFGIRAAVLIAVCIATLPFVRVHMAEMYEIAAYR